MWLLEERGARLRRNCWWNAKQGFIGMAGGKPNKASAVWVVEPQQDFVGIVGGPRASPRRYACACDRSLFGTGRTQATMISRPRLEAQETGPPPTSWGPYWTLLLLQIVCRL